MASRADEEAWQRMEDTWQELSSTLARRLKTIQECQNLNQQRILMDEAQADANDVSQQLESMSSEIRHLPYGLKQRAQRSVQAHQTDFEKMSTQLRRFENSVAQGQLAGSSHMDKVARLRTDDQTRYMEQRQALLSGANILNEEDASLTRTQHVLAETEAIGAATNAQLVQQREQFHNQLHNVHETNDFISRSKRTLQRMHKRLVTNKIMQGAIILVQCAAVGLIVWLKYYR